MRIAIGNVAVVAKAVMRREPGSHYRLFRVSIDRPRVVPGEGWMYECLSVGLERKLFRWQDDSSGFISTILGIRLHSKVVYGGRCPD